MRREVKRTPGRKQNLSRIYYISPSFRGEDPDATHLNQFYHVECELLGDMDEAISTAEGYLSHLTKSMLKKHSDMILNTGPLHMSKRC